MLKMSSFLNDFAAYIREKGYNVFSIAEICGGVAEDMQLLRTNRCQDSYSVAKAFVVTALGFLYDDGLISPDERIADIFPEYTPADARWQGATIDMALRHSLGLPGGYMDIDCAPMHTFGRDFLECLFACPLDSAPGEKYCYTDAAFYLLARAAEKRAGRPLIDLMWDRLFGPLMFTEAAWSTCPLGHAMGATGLYITSSDMAKLGALYLGGGMWQGRRILSEEWVKIVLERGYELKPTGIGKSYGKGGMYSQMLLVVPETDRAVAWHAFDDGVNRDLIRFCAEYR